MLLIINYAKFCPELKGLPVYFFTPLPILQKESESECCKKRQCLWTQLSVCLESNEALQVAFAGQAFDD